MQLHIQLAENSFICASCSPKPEHSSQSCSIWLEPVTSSQRRLPEPSAVLVRGLLQGWEASVSLSHTAASEAWVLQSSSTSSQEQATLQHLLMGLSAQNLSLVSGAAFTIHVFSNQILHLSWLITVFLMLPSVC